MRRYHFRVALLTLGVVLGFGSAIARFGFGYRFGHDCHHHHHHHHDDWHEAGHGHEHGPSAEGAAK
jgi:hypothetical protein